LKVKKAADIDRYFERIQEFLSMKGLEEFDKDCGIHVVEMGVQMVKILKSQHTLEQQLLKLKIAYEPKIIETKTRRKMLENFITKID
jgi:Mn-dependent DtxR family transcriptional regulator